jgi:hypothetical protein
MILGKPYRRMKSNDCGWKASRHVCGIVFKGVGSDGSIARDVYLYASLCPSFDDACSGAPWFKYAHCFRQRNLQLPMIYLARFAYLGPPLTKTKTLHPIHIHDRALFIKVSFNLTHEAE